MATYQAFNKRNKSWVKYRKTAKGSRIVNVKQKNSSRPFKGVKKR